MHTEGTRGWFAFGTIGIILGPAIFALLLALLRQLPNVEQPAAAPPIPLAPAVPENLSS